MSEISKKLALLAYRTIKQSSNKNDSKFHVSYEMATKLAQLGLLNDLSSRVDLDHSVGLAHREIHIISKSGARGKRTVVFKAGEEDWEGVKFVMLEVLALAVGLAYYGVLTALTLFYAYGLTYLLSGVYLLGAVIGTIIVALPILRYRSMS